MEYFSKFEAAGATSDQGFAISEGPGAKTGSVDCQTDYVHIPNIIAQTPATPVPATEPLVVSIVRVVALYYVIDKSRQISDLNIGAMDISLYNAIS